MNWLRKTQASEWFSDENTVSMVEAAVANARARAVQSHTAGGDPNALGREGMTPLMFVLSKRSNAGIEILLELGADPNYFALGMPSIMARAAGLKSSSLLRLLLSKGGDPDLCPDGEPLIFTATLAENFTNVWLLLDSGANVNATDFTGKNLVMLLAVMRRWDLLVKTLERGGSWQITSNVGQTAEYLVDRAFEENPDTLPEEYWEVVNLMKKDGATLVATQLPPVE